MRARCSWDGRMSEAQTNIVPPTRVEIKFPSRRQFFEWLCVWEAIHWGAPAGYYTQTGVAL